MMTKIKISQLRENISDWANKVQYKGEHICVEKHGKPSFAMVTLKELELLEKLELTVDLDLALQALKGGKFVEWDQVKEKMDG